MYVCKSICMKELRLLARDTLEDNSDNSYHMRNLVTLIVRSNKKSSTVPNLVDT